MSKPRLPMGVFTYPLFTIEGGVAGVMAYVYRDLPAHSAALDKTYLAFTVDFNYEKPRIKLKWATGMSSLLYSPAQRVINGILLNSDKLFQP